MKWSKFNFLFFSKKFHEYFLYNSSTNAFLKLNHELFEILKKIESKKCEIDVLDLEIYQQLIKAKVIVDDKYDENYILEQKLIKLSSAFSPELLQLVVAPTLSCNFSCLYCYEKDIKGGIR